jgi:hypothetical protein
VIVDSPRKQVAGDAPHVVQQFVPRHNLSSTPDKIMQNFELARR